MLTINSTVTQPGLPRSYYIGHDKTESCIGEAQRHLNEVIFSGLPGQVDPSPSRTTDYSLRGIMTSGPRNPGEGPPESPSYLPALPGPNFGGYYDTANSNSNFPVPQSSPYESSQPSPAQAYAAASVNRSVDDFGVGSSSTMGPFSPRLGLGSGAGGGKFATFPVKGSSRPGVQLRDEAPPSLEQPSQRRPSLSFSLQVAEALNSSGNASYSSTNAENQNRADGSGGNNNLTDRAPGLDEPVPVYEAIASIHYGTPPAPTLANPWDDSVGEDNTAEAPPRTSVDESAEIHLAYMSSVSDISHRAADKHAGFGATNDIDHSAEGRNEYNEGGNREDEAATATSPDAEEGLVDFHSGS